MTLFSSKAAEVADALTSFAEAQRRLGQAMEESAAATEAFGLEWWRWKLQFLTNATDEEAAEAARLFGWDLIRPAR